MNNKKELTEEEFKDILAEHKNRLNKNFSFPGLILEYEKILKEITSAQEAFILLLNQNGKNINVVSKQIDIPISDKSNVEGILFECFYSKEPYIATHARRNSFYRKNIDNFINAKINDILVMPILDHNDKKDIIAIVWIATTDTNKNPFSQNDIDYIKIFSTLIHAKILANDRKEVEPDIEVKPDIDMVPDIEPDIEVANKPLPEEDTDIINILIVDDSVFILRFLEVILKDYPTNIITAKSGIESIERFKHKRIDLILMDEIMVGMPGHEAIQIIRQIEKEKQFDSIPIIGLTSDNSKETRDILLEMGANLVLYKPIEADHIIEAIQKFIIL